MVEGVSMVPMAEMTWNHLILLFCCCCEIIRITKYLVKMSSERSDYDQIMIVFIYSLLWLENWLLVLWTAWNLNLPMGMNKVSVYLSINFIFFTSKKQDEKEGVTIFFNSLFICFRIFCIIMHRDSFSFLC